MLTSVGGINNSKEGMDTCTEHEPSDSLSLSLSLSRSPYRRELVEADAVPLLCLVAPFRRCFTTGTDSMSVPDVDRVTEGPRDRVPRDVDEPADPPRPLTTADMGRGGEVPEFAPRTGVVSPPKVTG